MPSRKHSPGDFRRRATIQSQSTTPDGGGGGTVAWAAVCTVWAKVWPISGREAVVGEALRAEEQTLVVIRYRSDITADMRVLVDGLTYTINALSDPESRHEWTELLCNKGAPT